MATFFRNKLCLMNTCNTTKQEKVANCSNITNLLPVLSNLPEKLEELILWNVTMYFGEFSANWFRRYPYLKKLDLRNVRSLFDEMEFHENTFITLKYLQTLLLQSIRFDSVQNADYVWPENLRTLEVIDISPLYHLKHTESLAALTNFKVASTNLKSFPRFNQLAPLRSIVLEENPIDIIHVREIAPFCLLQVFQFSFTDRRKIHGVHFLSPERSCDCLRFQNWLRTRKIAVTFTCAIYGKGVEGIKTGNHSCSNASEFSEEELDIFDECVIRHTRGKLFELILYAVLFTMLFPLAYFAIEACDLFTSSTKEDTVEQPVDQKRRRRVSCRRHGSSIESDYEEECQENEAEPDDV